MTFNSGLIPNNWLLILTFSLPTSVSSVCLQRLSPSVSLRLSYIYSLFTEKSSSLLLKSFMAKCVSIYPDASIVESETGGL